MSERLELPPTPASVAVARRWVAEVVAAAGLEASSDAVVLLVSELVTNVVLHARTPCQLVLDTDGPRIRVEVHDGSDRLPAGTIQHDPFALSGRGMLLVDALSAAHGSEPLEGGGKLVWVEIDRPAEPAP